MSDRRTVGIDIGGTHLRGAVLVEGAHLTGLRRIELPRDPRSRLGLLLELCAALAPDTEAIGIAVAGVVTEGRLVESANSALPPVDIRTVVQDAVARPVRVINDAQAVGLAESRPQDGGPPPTGVTLVATVGTGIGGALIVDGGLVQGRGHAGEIGHLTVDRNGPQCPCGSRGCLELYSSGAALQRAADRLYPGRGIAALISLAEQGDTEARDAVWQSAEAFADGLNSVAAVVAPTRVILGGGVIARRGIVARMYAERLSSRRWLTDSILQFARSGDAAGVIGAAAAAESAI
ncbi:ROK family protein [Microbacterium sulfonylureivorans]|uniref:ROK family protein n=1 Tax=Microbacterium sulfonylureivorans TaxID=2486854 RepID=UPI000FDAF75D|nr:ROK family protein [Microbacterium sulfonylureivorans]